MIEELYLLGKVAAAMVLAGLVGFEREADRKAAGLRTHMLVGGAAALLMVAGIGVTIAVEAWVVALGVTLLTLAVLRVLALLDTPKGHDNGD